MGIKANGGGKGYKEEMSDSIEVYTSCVKAAFFLLTTRGRLLWLYRSIYYMG